MHSADHQHMGKTRRPVGTAKVFGQMSAVTQHHGRQHSRRALCHPLAQSPAQPLLEPRRFGPEALTRTQALHS